MRRAGMAALACAALMNAGCDDGDGDAADSGPPAAQLPAGCDYLVEPSAQDQEQLQTVLIEADPESTVCLAEGTYTFGAELSISVDGLTLKGAGPEKTVLDFSGQDVGANGLLITGNAVTVEGLAVLEAAGDGIRANAVTGIVFRDLRVIWETPSNAANGAYGLYPVGCTDVLVERCYVRGASDAGIYVGQSSNILVRDSEAEGNVAGIEIENSTDAEVTNCHAHDNTGGILVFNLPELPVKNGQRAKIHGNVIENNNLPNFGKAGSSVSKVPGGTGAFILAADYNEFTDNDVRGNESVGFIVISYIDAVLGAYEDPDFDIYAEGNYIHGNRFEGNGTAPQGIIKDLGLPIPGPDMMIDGCNAEGQLEDPARINCFDEAASARFRDIDFCGALANPSDDVEPYRCTHDPLPAISL